MFSLLGFDNSGLLAVTKFSFIKHRYTFRHCNHLTGSTQTKLFTTTFYKKSPRAKRATKATSLRKDKSDELELSVTVKHL